MTNRNSMEIKPPNKGVLTVGQLLDYLHEMEQLWSADDVKYLGEFKDHPIMCEYVPPTEQCHGIGFSKIVYDGGLGFVILSEDLK